MKILVIGDLHGQIPRLHFKKFDAVICVGDFCSSDKIWKIFKKAYLKFLKDPTHTTSWFDIIKKSAAKKLVKKSLSDGRKILEILDKLDVPIYTIPGNWDYADKDDEWEYLNKDFYKDYLLKGLKNIKDCNNKIVKLEGYDMIGYGIVNGPELLKYRNYNGLPDGRIKKNEREYKKLSTKYDKMFRKARRPVIFLSHNVPFNTKLDMINNRDSPMDGKHYGSNLARDMILKYKPILCIAGHMHEHYGTCKLGKTVVLNAGFGGDKNTLIELKDGKIKNISFHGKRC